MIDRKTSGVLLLILFVRVQRAGKIIFVNLEKKNQPGTYQCHSKNKTICHFDNQLLPEFPTL